MPDSDPVVQLQATMKALEETSARCAVLVNGDHPEFELMEAERTRLCAEAAQLQAQIGREICDRCSR